jgi:hypothetical protein
MSLINKPGIRAGGNMIRISLSFFYGLGASVRLLPSISAGQKLSDVWITAWTARAELSNLLSAAWFAPAMKAAIGPGNTLLTSLSAIIDRSDFDEQITFPEASAITGAYNHFDTVLKSELLVADAYFVTSKFGYDTTTLIGNAENHFPAELPTKSPESIGDLREAGKCLAFELSTAAGFHVLRATESVVRSYWTAVSKGAPHPRPKTMGTYARKLEEQKLGQKKTVETLKQITALHRNPLIHPNESLNLEEAIGLFAICRSAIAAMLKEIPAQVPKPPLASFAAPPPPP